MERAVSFSSYVLPSFLSIVRYCDFVNISYTEVTMAINQAIHMFLDRGYHTHFLILDLDHVHPVDIVQRLARWVIKDREIKVVGGVNYRRSVPYDPAAYRIVGEHKLQTFSSDELKQCEREGKLLEVDSMGAGCLLIAKEVFEAIDPPWWEWDYKSYKKGDVRSPDAYFCEKAKEKGFKIWADPSTCSPHVGVTFINRDTHDEFNRLRMEMEKHDEV
jgi:GT2 family glycosyltransferase